MILNKDNIKEIIAQLTPEQKAKFCLGLPDPSDYRFAARNQVIEELGIPSTVFADGPQGIRGETPTVCYPCATLLAQTWDDEAIEAASEGMGIIGEEFGVDLFLAPGMNIQRNILNGRNFEYFSEDPLIAGHAASAYVKGVQKSGTGACIKHFCANSQEKYRSVNSSEVSERALREIYIRAFGYAIKHSDPYGLMTCYNQVNGTFGAADKGLIKDVLRDEFGYEGLVTSDWGAGGGLVNMLKVTNDMFSGTGDLAGDIKRITDAMENGDISEEEVDACLEHIFNYILKTNAYTKKNAGETGKVGEPAKRAAESRKAATEGIVLMKNDNALPFKKGNVALFGNASYKAQIYGWGSGRCDTVNAVSSLKTAVEERDGLTLNAAAAAKYENMIEPLPIFADGVDNPVDDQNEIEIDVETAKKAATESDIAIYAFMRHVAEGTDSQPLRGDYLLNDVEREAIENLSEAFHAAGKKLVVVINSGLQIEMASWEKLADAIIYIAYPGEQLGNATFDIITGDVNPSGKLAATWPVRYADTPQADCFPGSRLKTCYCEDIYVGYRYYETFGVPVSYPFGHGLSYTTFDMSDFTAKKLDNDEIELTLKVTNTGNVAGREVAEFYVTIPDGVNEHPAVELCGFKKTKLLNPGESEVVKVLVTDEELQTYVTDGAKWIREAGVYKFSARKNAHDTIMTQELDLGAEKLVKQVVNIADDKRLKFRRLSKR